MDKYIFNELIMRRRSHKYNSCQLHFLRQRLYGPTTFRLENRIIIKKRINIALWKICIVLWWGPSLSVHVINYVLLLRNFIFILWNARILGLFCSDSLPKQSVSKTLSSIWLEKESKETFKLSFQLSWDSFWTICSLNKHETVDAVFSVFKVHNVQHLFEVSSWGRIG